MHSANRQKLSTAVLIAQKLAQLCYLPKTKHKCEPGSPEPQDGKLFTLAAHPRWGVETNESGLK